jgi:hypothetical protein
VAINGEICMHNCGAVEATQQLHPHSLHLGRGRGRDSVDGGKKQEMSGEEEGKKEKNGGGVGKSGTCVEGTGRLEKVKRCS